jgi:hypothetical protein
VTSAESVLGEVAGAGSAVVEGEGLWQTGNLAGRLADAAGVAIEAARGGEPERLRRLPCSATAAASRTWSAPRWSREDCRGSLDLVRADELQIGPLGKVSVERGAEIEGDTASIQIGTGSGVADCLGLACLDLVEGRVDVNGIDVGFTGPGKMQIGPLGRATGLVTFVGAAPRRKGSLVRGPSPEPQLVSGLSVGFDVGSHGELVLQSGARVTADLATVGGAGPGAFGRSSSRDDSVLRITDQLGIGFRAGRPHLLDG